ncbi:hypothetical protein ACM26V_03500 [Salipaludibacillus sp. HK11]|uniref:hypothetical protein n=1 Tax=Salipaludibacillus sp. HK11 TaxID=3394320 RepID=UPI0039FC83C1
MYHLKVEADFSADPIWCIKCGCNLDIRLFSISNELIKELKNWILKYGEWIDMEDDTLVSNGVELEAQHNRIGRELTERVKKELGEGYDVIFSPSTFASNYPM